MLNLLVKDFKLMFVKERSLAKKIITAIVSVIFVACFVVLEIILYTAVLKKLATYKNAPEAFVTLFLAVLSILMIISGVLQAKKLFFNEKDIQQLSNHPVSNSQIIFSKLIFLFLSHYATCFIFVYPLFFAYGQIFTKTLIFYYTALFYPVLSFLFETGIALIFVYPVWLFSQYLKKHLLLQFGLALIFLLVATYLYANLLTTFISLVANNELTSLFSPAAIAQFMKVEKFLIPINFLTDIFITKTPNAMFPFLLISGGVFALGASITVFAFHYVRNVSVTATPKRGKHKVKLLPPVKALIKKEVILLLKNSNYIFSFSGLLIIQPFLLFLIVNALNTIFSAGLFRYYLLLIPNFITLMDFLVIIMFTLIINQGANSYIAMEERTIKNMKTIPVSYKTQLLVKMLIPFAMSFISLFVSVLFLVIFGEISIVSGLIALLLSTICLFVFDVISLREELNIRHGKGRSTALSTIYAYLLPFSYVACGILLSYLGTSLLAIYGAGILILFLFGLPHMIYVKQNMGSLFMDLEAIN